MAATRLSPDKNSSLRIVVLGYLVRGPMGGMAWHHLQYAMGLRDLGHDVYFLEDSGDSQWCCYDPARGVTDTDPTYGLNFATRTFQRVGLEDAWSYYDAHTSQWFGPAASRNAEICGQADLLLNLSFSNTLRPWTLEVPVRVLVETDPVFTQIRNLTDAARQKRARQHTAFFTFGENIGRPGSNIPDDGLPWQVTRQPVVLDAWPVVAGPQDGPFTTVMQWDSYAAREFAGVRYGMKSESFQAFLDLPLERRLPFELAVGSPTTPQKLLKSKGWSLRDPLTVTADPWTYQDFIQRSKGEFSVAKQGYVISRSGWFSERSAAYLASGRPAIVQETGFSDWMETGSGVMSFDTFADARRALDDVNGRYEFHCQAARDIAAAYFDARLVLPSLIERTLTSEGGAGSASMVQE